MTAQEIAILLSAKNTAKGILEAAQGDVRGFERALDGAARTSRTVSAQMEADMKRVAAATKGLGVSGAVNDFEAYAGKAEGTAARVAAASSGMSGSVSIAGGLAGAALMGAGVGAGVMAAQFVTSSAEAATNFEAMTTRIAHNAGLSKDQTDDLRKSIVDLNLQTGQPLDKLAAGYMHIVDVTHNTSNAQDILASATKAATAAGGDAEHYANILALTMHEYGTDTSNAATETERQAEVQANASKAMNVMRQAAMDSNLSLQDFADHTARVTGLAARLGIPLEDVDAAYASLTKRGFDAAGAQTQLIGAMTHMINPSQAAQKELAKLSQATGIDLVHDFSAAGLSEGGLQKAMDDLNLAFMKQGDTQAVATQESMKLVNAQRGGLGVAALATNAQSDYNDELDKLQGVAGNAKTMDDQYNETLDTTQNRVDRTTAKFDLLKRKIGDDLLPVENNLLDLLLDPRGAWEKNEQAVKNSSDAMDQHQAKLMEFYDQGGPNTILTAGAIGTTFSNLGSTMHSVLFDDIGGGFDNLGSKAHDAEINLKIAARNIENDLAGMVRNADSWLANLAGNLMHDIGLESEVNHYADGTNYAPGGVALVGERGPELVRLPRGAQVIPNHRLGEARGAAIDYDKLAKAIARALPQPSLRAAAAERAESRRMGQTLAVLSGTVAGLETVVRRLEGRLEPVAA